MKLIKKQNIMALIAALAVAAFTLGCEKSESEKIEDAMKDAGKEAEKAGEAAKDAVKDASK